MTQTPSEHARAREVLMSGDAGRALPLYEKLARQHADAGVWYEYGNAAAKCQKLALAEHAWNKALELAGKNAELMGVIGHQFQAYRRVEQARACFSRAAAADPRDINSRISLAVTWERAHRLPEARKAIAECLAIDPRDEQARYFAAVLDRREEEMEKAERTLRELTGREIKHPYVRYAAHYELGQLLDRTGRFDEAMECLRKAKEIVSGLTNTAALIASYDQTVESVKRFTAAQPRDILGTWAKYFPPSKRSTIPRLAFLGGHPRSGTTLLEQVLDAHPEVAALDEPTAFLEVLQPEFHKAARNLSSARVNVLRRHYIEALLNDLGGGAEGKLLLDKNPSPTTRLALWLRVFPELRVIIALRHPCDVALSCYFQNIPLNAANVNFLTLERTARHYADLMSVWLAVREWPGFAWMETRYEDVTANLRSEGRRVTEFLGLPWHPDQERFHEKSAGKQLYSPTYQDVTRPVYQRSVGRWRAYEKYLAPILPLLEPYCRALGYEI